MKQRTSPAPGLGQELDTNFRESYPSTKSSGLTNYGNNRKTPKQIARRRSSCGYYPTPSEAMRVLLGGASHGY